MQSCGQGQYTAPVHARNGQMSARFLRAGAAALLLLLAALWLHGRSAAQTPQPTPGPALTNLGLIYYVDNDAGNDSFDCSAPAVAAPPASGVIPGPCKTIQHAVDLTRDRDLVVVASQEPVQLTAPVEVRNLIGVVASGQIPTQCQGFTGQSRCSRVPCEDVAGGARVVLQSVSGAPVFHVRGKGVGQPETSHSSATC